MVDLEEERTRCDVDECLLYLTVSTRAVCRVGGPVYVRTVEVSSEDDVALKPLTDEGGGGETGVPGENP